MGICRYLAMTAAEIEAASRFPQGFAYMACHFSPYGTGLSNCPAALPPGAMLILNDRTPIFGHDPERIAMQLASLVTELECGSVLLDLQRPENAETAALCVKLSGSLPCPAGISHLYAGGLDGPVFLPPVPPDIPLADYLRPWAGREIWLEAALDASCVTVTRQESTVTELPWSEPPEGCFTDQALHCRYRIEESEDALRFYFWRTPELLENILVEAESLGVTKAVGLHQQLAGYSCWE